MDGPLPSPGWSSAILGMVTVTHQREAYYSLGIWPLDLTHKTNWHGWSPIILGWSPTNPGVVTYKKKVYYRLWHLDSTHKTNNR